MSGSPLSVVNGHWLAGFIEAEGSFSVSDNNAGATWLCEFSLSQRDDERELMSQVQGWTGLGSLRWSPEVGGARPQLRWTVARKAECVDLVRILDRFPLRGRKRREFRLWAEAVRIWNESPADATRWRDLGVIARRLREARKFGHSKAQASGTVLHRGESFRRFTGGFVTGEGCFTFPANGRPRFQVKVRCDDRRLIESLQSAAGLGYVTDGPAHGSSRPTCSWVVLRHAELAPLANYLAGTLRGRRARELEAWSAAATEHQLAIKENRPRRRRVLQEARTRFLKARSYHPIPHSNPMHAGANGGELALNALRKWAYEEPGALSCVAYDRWRTRQRGPLPTRNTIANRFGSWSNALEAADLGRRTASTPEQRRARAAGRKSTHSARRDDERRRQVVSAIGDLARILGRSPRANEYFSWRHQNRRDLPSQASTYRLFPGGWAAAVRAAGFRVTSR